MIEKILRHRRFIRSIFSRVKISFRVAVPLTILLGSVVAWGFMVDVSEKINRFIVGQNEIAIEEEFLAPQSLTAGSEITKKGLGKKYRND